MTRCVDCGFCGFYIDLAGLAGGRQWLEMDKQVRSTFEQGEELNPPGINPGTGHWNFVLCNEYLHEWEGWLNGAPDMGTLRDSLTRGRECTRYTKYRAGLTPPEHHTVPQTPDGGSYEVPEYDVFLSHSKYEDDLAKEVQRLLEHNGIRTFTTPGSIPTGKWEPQIEEALQRSKHIWVLLTPSAVFRSRWVHHEFGYFYGFRHGKAQDPKGKQCHFLFVSGTELDGLYNEIQGDCIDSFADPEALARNIAKALDKDLAPPPEYVSRSFPTMQVSIVPPLEADLQAFEKERGAL